MLARRDPEGVRRRPVSWRNVVLAGLVAVGVIVYLRMAVAKFKWWDQTSFKGQVVGKEARLRDSEEAVTEAAALQDPGKCRFFLDIAGEKGTDRHEVVLSVFRKARLGDHLVKPAGTYGVRHTRGDAPAPAPQERAKP